MDDTRTILDRATETTGCNDETKLTLLCEFLDAQPKALQQQFQAFVAGKVADDEDATPAPDA